MTSICKGVKHTKAEVPHRGVAAVSFFVKATKTNGVACLTHSSYVLVSVTGDVTPDEVVIRSAVPLKMLEGHVSLMLAE